MLDNDNFTRAASILFLDDGVNNNWENDSVTSPSSTVTISSSASSTATPPLPPFAAQFPVSCTTDHGGGGGCRSNTELFRTVAIIYSTILIFLILLLNLPVFAALVFLNKHRLKATNVLTLSLGLADLLGAFVYLPLLIIVLLRGQSADCGGTCAALMAVERLQVAASVWNIALISLDRYLFVMKKEAHQNLMTLKMAAFWIASVWVAAGAFGVVAYFQTRSSSHVTGECICHLALGDGAQGPGTASLGFSSVFAMAVYVVPTAIMLGLYACLMRHSFCCASCCACCSNQRRPGGGERPSKGDFIPVTNWSSSCPPADPDDPEAAGPGGVGPLRHLWTVKMLAVLLSLYLLTTSPYFIVTFVVSLGQWPVHTHPYYLHIMSVLLFNTNSSCNAIFYAYSSRRLRAILTHCLCPRRLRDPPSSSRCKAVTHDAVVSEYGPDSSALNDLATTSGGATGGGVVNHGATSSVATACDGDGRLTRSRNLSGLSTMTGISESC